MSEFFFHSEKSIVRVVVLAQGNLFSSVSAAVAYLEIELIYIIMNYFNCQQIVEKNLENQWKIKKSSWRSAKLSYFIKHMSLGQSLLMYVCMHVCSVAAA